MIALVVAASLASAAAVDEHPGAQLPLATPFLDTHGTPTTLGAALGGRPALLVLAYAHCTMLCGTVLHGIADASAGIDAPLVVISIDPHETPDDGAIRASHIGRDATYLVGAEPAIHAVADALGFRYRWDASSQQFVHPAVFFAITADGRVSHYLYGVRWTHADVAHALDDAAAGRVAAATTSEGLLACFHADAAAAGALRRVQSVIRAFAGLLFVGLATFLWILWRRR